MPSDEYARFRNSTDCGHMTGTVYTGPKVCGKPATHRVDPAFPVNVNHLACGTHANVAKRSLYAVTPLLKES